MEVERNRDLVRGFVEAVNGRDYGALASIVAPDFRRHSQATPDVRVESREDLEAFLRRDEGTFPDNRVVLHEIVAEGDRVAIWATYSGTQEGPMGPFPPSGRRLEVDFGGVFRVEHDRLAELHVTWDNVTVLTQLGHLATPGPGA